MFLHFRVFGLCWFQLDDWTVFVHIENNGSNGVFVCSRHEGGFSLYSCGLSPWLVTYCILKKLLSPVFRSYSIKAVLKLIVCILPTRDFAGKILVSTMDTLLQQYSLQLYNLSNLGPVHEKTPMNICCHPLRVETWMLQPLTGERTQTVLVKSNIGDKNEKKVDLEEPHIPCTPSLFPVCQWKWVQQPFLTTKIWIQVFRQVRTFRFYSMRTRSRQSTFVDKIVHNRIRTNASWWAFVKSINKPIGNYWKKIKIGQHEKGQLQISNTE